MIRCPICAKKLRGLADLAEHAPAAHAVRLVEARSYAGGAVTYFTCFCGRGEYVSVGEETMLGHYRGQGGLVEHLLAYLLLDEKPRAGPTDLKVGQSPDLEHMTGQQILDATNAEAEAVLPEMLGEFFKGGKAMADVVPLSHECFLCGQRTVDEVALIDHFLRAHCWPFKFFRRNFDNKTAWCWCGAGFDFSPAFFAIVADHFERCGGLQAHYAAMLLNLDDRRLDL